MIFQLNWLTCIYFNGSPGKCAILLIIRKAIEGRIYSDILRVGGEYREIKLALN